MAYAAVISVKHIIKHLEHPTISPKIKASASKRSGSKLKAVLDNPVDGEDDEEGAVSLNAIRYFFREANNWSRIVVTTRHSWDVTNHLCIASLNIDFLGTLDVMWPIIFRTSSLEIEYFLYDENNWDLFYQNAFVDQVFAIPPDRVRGNREEDLWEVQRTFPHNCCGWRLSQKTPQWIKNTGISCFTEIK